MATGKVLSLYMTIPDMMKSGHRGKCDDFDCDESGIIGDVHYDNGSENVMLLVSKASYDIVEEADVEISKGFLLENIYVDIDLNHLQKGSIIEVGETLFEVTGSCNIFNYIYPFAPEVPDLLENKRGIYITPCEYGTVEIGNEVSIVKEA